jgi:hypothetical protein
MLTIGNDELEKNAAIGEMIDCPHCGEIHPIQYGNEVMEDGTKKPSKLLAFYKCGDEIYLAGIAGKRI